MPTLTDPNCWYCRFLEIDLGSASYSEYTPGRSGDAGCRKGRWTLDAEGDQIHALRSLCQTKAIGCSDFAPAREER